MPSKVLDTNILITYWQKRRQGKPLSEINELEAAEWGQAVARLYDAAIVTPVYMEFIGGALDSHALRLSRAFLRELPLVDQGRILPVDWEQALRRAERIPRIARPRQLGDCLIASIARRLRLDVITNDSMFPH